MRLVTYSIGSNAARLGALKDGLVVDVENFGAARGLDLPSDMLAFIDNNATLLPLLRDRLNDGNAMLPGALRFRSRT